MVQESDDARPLLAALALLFLTVLTATGFVRSAPADARLRGGEAVGREALPDAPAQPPWRWETAASMTVGRGDHSATRLLNGDVLVAGGSDENGERLASTEIYDWVTGTWRATGSMAVPREQHTATLLPDGRVLVTGDSGNTTDPTVPLQCGDDTAELYDPSTGSWHLTGSLYHPRCGHTATMLDSGELLVAGGTAGREFAELYSSTYGTWRSANWWSQMRYQTATKLVDGRVLFVSDNNVSLFHDESREPDAPQLPRLFHLAAPLPSGQVLVAGGADMEMDSWATDSSEVFTLSDAPWPEPAGTWTTTGPLNVARYGMSSVVTPDGSVIAVGGVSHAGFWTYDSVERYDPASGRWGQLPSMSVDRQRHTATLLESGNVLVCGGGSTQSEEPQGALESCELLIDGRPLPEEHAAFLPVAARRAVLRTAPSSLEYVGQIGGPAWDVAVAGEIAYLTLGAHVVAFDLTDPASPRYIGQSPVLPGVAYGVAVAGDHAYAAVDDSQELTNEGGLYVLDVSNPAAMTVLGALALSGGATDLVVDGNTAFVVAGGIYRLANHINVVDVTDARAPRAIARIGDPSPFGWATESCAVAVSGGHLFVCDGRVYDVGVPSQPTLKTTVDVWNYSGRPRLAVDGDRAYWVEGEYWGGFRIRVFDIATPSSPALLGEVNTDSGYPNTLGWVGRIAVTGDRLLLPGSARLNEREVGSLTCIDVSNPAAPAVIDITETPDVGTAIGVHDGQALAAAMRSGPGGEFDPGMAFSFSYGSGWMSLSLPPPQPPTVTRAWRSPFDLQTLVPVSSDVAYAREGEALAILDFASPERPVVSGYLDLPGNPLPVWWEAGSARVQDGYAWIGSNGRWLLIDATVPREPRILGAHQGIDVPVVANGRLHYFERSAGPGEPDRLVVADFADPTRPQELGALRLDWLDGRVGDLLLEDDLAYLTHSDGVEVVDVRDPRRVHLVGSYAITLRYGHRNAVSGGRFYALHGDRSTVISVVDFTDPTAARTIGRLELPDDYPSRDMVLVGSRAYVMSGDGVFEVNIADPTRPRLVGLLKTPTWFHALEEYAHNGGLVIEMYDPRIEAVGEHLVVGYGTFGGSVIGRRGE